MILTTALFSQLALAAKPVCGDGTVRGGESCDGTDLDGATCESLGFDGGTLSCDSGCDYDTSSCTTASVGVCGDDVVEDYEECDGSSDSACPGACSSHCACPSMPAGDLEIHMIDVGQGDSILVVSPDGFTMLVDAGTESQSATVESYLTSVGVSELDYTLVTHMDADHVGGMDGVLANHPEVTTCFDHGGTYTTTQYDEYDAAADTRRTTLSTTDFVDLGPSITAEVLHALDGGSSENDHSVVLKLSYVDNTALLGGDCEGACEASFDPGHIDLYKVHHHGSSSSTTQALVDQMDPYTALISVGASNAYGHPTQETLDRLTDAGATIYRTDLDGDLEVLVDGTVYTVNGEAVCSAEETRTCGDSDVGACSYGARACVSGMWDSTCSGEVTPVTEICDNGADDDCDGATDGADADCAPAASHVVVSQVAYDTPGTDSEEEFVDLFNPTGADQPLDGWSLEDAGGSWSFPAGSSVAASGYLSVARNAAGFSALHGLQPDVDGMTLSLGNSGDSLRLVDDGGAEVDRVAWEDFESGWSISASTGDSLERSDPTADSDGASDWSVTSPAAPRGGVVDDCGNGVCDPGEDCNSCSADCDGVQSGKPANRWCCGDGTCDDFAEDAGTCAVDCG